MLDRERYKAILGAVIWVSGLATFAYLYTIGGAIPAGIVFAVTVLLVLVIAVAN